jgi:carboxynorspermidine decarboxylase
MLVLKQHQIELKWFNLGGGYLIDSGNDFLPLVDTIRWLQDNFSVDVYFEPGKAVTGNAGYLIASVIDLFHSGGEQIAILDTSINHLPEVFEYQYQPKVMYSHDITDYKYHLAGSSCLSGDLFGEYCFEDPLELGSLVVFENVGAYMQVKANMFNGINLPSIYLLDENSNFRLLKEYDYNSFRDRL